MYEDGLAQARDEVMLAQGERDLYHRRLQSAQKERERVIKVLADVRAEHQGQGERCSCGQRRCRTRELLRSDPRVLPLLRRHDEHQRALRELQRANPDVWIDRWDYIDITLAYPDSSRPRARAGRHRATG
jgi:hypothetical protein